MAARGSSALALSQHTRSGSGCWDERVGRGGRWGKGRDGWGRWEGEKKELEREQLVQIKSGDCCVSFTLQLPVCVKVRFISAIQSKLIIVCDAESIMFRWKIRFYPNLLQPTAKTTTPAPLFGPLAAVEWKTSMEIIPVCFLENEPHT